MSVRDPGYNISLRVPKAVPDSLIPHLFRSSPPLIAFVITQANKVAISRSKYLSVRCLKAVETAGDGRSYSAAPVNHISPTIGSICDSPSRGNSPLLLELHLTVSYAGTYQGSCFLSVSEKGLHLIRIGLAKKKSPTYGVLLDRQARNRDLTCQ